MHGITMDLAEVMSRIHEEMEEEVLPDIQREAMAHALVERLEIFNKPAPVFKVGDLVQQRSDTSCVYKFPKPGCPGIVAELDVNTVIIGNGSFTKDSMAIGIIDPEGYFIQFLVDPRYFEHYTGPR